MTDNRNDQPDRPGSSQPQTQNTEGGANENPQEGTQWDNYQTRSLSSESGEKIEESDLLRADETARQNAGNAPANDR